MRTPRKKPRKLGLQDFNRRGQHAPLSHAFYLWFYYLRLSPTYFLAHKERRGRLSDAERECLPGDFDRVLATYDQFGDVWYMMFETWWRKNGLRLFGIQGKRARITNLISMPSGKDITLDECLRTMNEYLSEQRRAENWPAVLVLAIPLNRTKTDLMKALGGVLDEAGVASVEPVAEPLYQISCQRLHVKPLVRGIMLLAGKGLEPNLSLWRLGTDVGLSKKYGHLDRESTKLTKDTEEARTNLTMLTSRALRRAQLVMENAARGLFPSYDEVDLSHIAWKDINRRIRVANRCYKAEENKLQLAQEKKDCPNAS